MNDKTKTCVGFQHTFVHYIMESYNKFGEINKSTVLVLMDMLIQFIDLYALTTLVLWKNKSRKRRKLHHTYYRIMFVCSSLNLNDILLKKGH